MRNRYYCSVKMKNEQVGCLRMSGQNVGSSRKIKNRGIYHNVLFHFEIFSLKTINS